MWSVAKVLAGAVLGFVLGVRYRTTVIRHVVNTEDAVAAMTWQARADHLLDEVARLRGSRDKG